MSKTTITCLCICFLFMVSFCGPALSQDFEVLSNANLMFIKSQVASGSFAKELSELIDMELLCEVIKIAQTYHVDRGNFDKEKITKGIVQGFMQSLDKHSRFLTVEEAVRQEESISGRLFGGIGIILEIQKRCILVKEVVAGSPAKEAGIKSRDRITEVNGQKFKDLGEEKFINAIRGEVGSVVTLTVVRKGSEKPIHFKIKRALLDIQSVDCKTIVKNGQKFGVIKISSFNSNTYYQFLHQVSRLIYEKPDYIIIDLRNNPGGLVSCVSDILGDMVGHGKVIMQEETPEYGRTITYSNSLFEDGIFAAYKYSPKGTICLINENTASAAEIMSAGMNEILGMTLLGEATYGKGTGWRPVRLRSGKGTCNVTCFRWFTPNGNSIDQIGVDPTIEVFMDEVDRANNEDPQLDAAIKKLLKK